MNFEHTHERRMLADSISRYVTDRYGEVPARLVPQAAESFDPTHWSALAELGAVGALFDPTHGGYGGGPFDVMAVFEEMGRGLVSEPMLASLLAGRVLAHCASEATAPLLNGIMDGSVLASLAHCEPGGQWEPSDVQSRARRSGENWVLDGKKVGVHYGHQAQWLVVSARTSDATDSNAGISLFLMSANAPGLVVRDYPNLDGGRSAEVLLGGVTLGADALLGPLDGGTAALKDSIGHGILALCAEALGAMDYVMASTLDYLKTRKQFGEPIGSFQAIQHRMVDLMLHVDQSRSATINCAIHLDASDAIRDKYLAAAKFTVGTAATLVAQDCIQLHGGIGMTWELPVSHYAKRLALLNFQLGDEDHHLQQFATLSCV